MASRATTPTTAIAVLTGVTVVWKRVSAVSRTPRPSALGASVNTPVTAGRTSPARSATVTPSTRTAVRVGSEVIVTAQSPAGRSTGARSTAPVVIRSAPSRTVARSPFSGSAAGSGFRGTVLRAVRSTGPASPRSAAQLKDASSRTGWYGINGIASAADEVLPAGGHA
jgi:hypothetical protein